MCIIFLYQKVEYLTKLVIIHYARGDEDLYARHEEYRILEYVRTRTWSDPDPPVLRCLSRTKILPPKILVGKVILLKEHSVAFLMC